MHVTLFFKVISRTEKDAQVLVFSEGNVGPVVLTAEMSLMQITAQLVKVKRPKVKRRLPSTFLHFSKGDFVR